MGTETTTTTTHRSGTGPPAWRCGRRGARRAAPAQPPCPPGKARETCPQGVVPTSHRPSWGMRAPYLPEELLHQGFGPAAVHRPLLGGVADVGRVQQQRQHLGLIDPGEGTPVLRFVPKTSGTPHTHTQPRWAPALTSPAAAGTSSWTSPAGSGRTCRWPGPSRSPVPAAPCTPGKGENAVRVPCPGWGQSRGQGRGPYTNSSLVRLTKMFISSSCIMRKTALMWWFSSTERSL